MCGFLAAASRSASPVQYETTLKVFIESLSRSGLNLTNDKVGGVGLAEDSGAVDDRRSNVYPTASETNTISIQDRNRLRYAHHGSPSLLQTICILMCNSPEGTLLLSQRSLSLLLTCIASQFEAEERENSLKPASIPNEHGIAFACIQTIETLINAKPILFRNSDLSNFLTLASAMLTSKCSPIGKDIGQGNVKFFTHIVSTLLDCIRLRKDTMVPFLPQLTLLLTQLIGLFQVPVAANGNLDESEACKDVTQDDRAKESEPSSNVSTFGHRKKSKRTTLGIDEARLVTRLLSQLTSTSPSVGGSSSKSKVKSLAKPFSTHAPYVIVGYIKKMTSAGGGTATTAPYSFAKGETREELTRAIYTLCDIVGPWQKNVMMDLLADEGEKIVFRNIWRGWEAQRYRGA
ncbi:hypothetical protein CBS101457_002048 [Exobasidium rhododendri]|nr:hypothetical protein CBS101457_002048 [Exobasidium rhododendri]